MLDLGQNNCEAFSDFVMGGGCTDVQFVRRMIR